MTYPSMNSTILNSDLSYLFIYANDVTKGFFSLFIVISFFCVVVVGSLIAQLKISGRMRPEFSALAGSFATLGFAIILEQRTGILLATHFVVLIVITILSFIWVAMSQD